ncbi:hypothetical protein DFH07DRAFT_1056458 [Mycena maculata]|uniref:F-box domain-containing protein n=1 Tax=Mycena maculata TaxID=230809 RepID=A0AAD7K3S8_9AGAR|nr:hypothetical protein DFH07DRAFT_1056458 [Mycena maculata]
MRRHLSWLPSSFRLHPSQRTRRPISASRPRLPPELWDHVLDQLSDEDLFIAARVCTGFNERCIVIYFERRHISRDVSAAATLAISSDLLPVFQLWHLTPQIHTLVCRFWSFHILRNLGILRDLIARCDEIQEISLFFHRNVVDAHETDTIFPYPQQALLTAVADTMRAMTAKSTKPVVIVDSTVNVLGHFRSDNLKDWPRLGRRSWMDDTRFTVKACKSHPSLCKLVWRSGGQQNRLYAYIRDIHCISVVSHTAEPFTLVTVNKDTRSELTLGRSSFDPNKASPAELNIILPHISLPSLDSLFIREDIDPAILGQFL